MRVIDLGHGGTLWVPGYETVKVSTLTASGTVIAGVAGSAIVIEYHTQQNIGTADATLQMKDGTVVFNQNLLPYTPGQNFAYIGAPFPGREIRLAAANPFVITMTGSGSVVTNTRYWFEAS